MKVLSAFIIILVLFVSNISAQDSLKIQKEKPFVTVEQMPSYPGGETELYKFISNVDFSRVPIEDYGLQGRINIKFIVEPDGSISNIEIKSVRGDAINNAYKEVISKMPKWIPGKHHGKNVSVYQQLSIQIHLKYPD